MMINKRLINMVGENKKYVAGNVVMQWCNLAANVVIMGQVAGLLQKLYEKTADRKDYTVTAVEGVDQLETYFGAYLPQFFFSMIAPFTLFVILANVNLLSAVVLLICVPLIPVTMHRCIGHKWN